MWNLIWNPWVSLGKEVLCTCEEYKHCWVCTHSHNIEEFREYYYSDDLNKLIKSKYAI